MWVRTVSYKKHNKDRSLAGAAHDVSAALTGYASSAMVHCNIFFLRRIITMSCFVSIKGGRNGRRNAASKGTLL
jgi:hypothetical protein